MSRVGANLGKVAFHGFACGLRRSVLDRPEDAFVMALPALSAAGCAEDAAAMLMKNVDY